MPLPTHCPALIAENIGQLDDHGVLISLEEVAAAVISTVAHQASWRWNRQQNQVWRPLSIQGWRQALEDGQDALAKAESHAKQLRALLPLIEAEIDWQEHDANERKAQ